jgi:hypothetical protein
LSAACAACWEYLSARTDHSPGHTPRTPGGAPCPPCMCRLRRQLRPSPPLGGHHPAAAASAHQCAGTSAEPSFRPEQHVVMATPVAQLGKWANLRQSPLRATSVPAMAKPARLTQDECIATEIDSIASSDASGLRLQPLAPLAQSALQTLGSLALPAQLAVEHPPASRGAKSDPWCSDDLCVDLTHAHTGRLAMAIPNNPWTRRGSVHVSNQQEDKRVQLGEDVLVQMADRLCSASL